MSTLTKYFSFFGIIVTFFKTLLTLVLHLDNGFFFEFLDIALVLISPLISVCNLHYLISLLSVSLSVLAVSNITTISIVILDNEDYKQKLEDLLEQGQYLKIKKKPII